MMMNRTMQQVRRYLRHVINQGLGKDGLKQYETVSFMCRGNRLFSQSSGRYNVSHRNTTHSSLFISDSVAQHTAMVNVDLDLDQRLANTEQLKDNLNARGIENIQVDELVRNYNKMVELRERKNELHQLKKENAKAMKSLMAKGKHEENIEDKKKMFTQNGLQIKQEIKTVTREWWAVEEEVMNICLRLPVDLSPNTPQGEEKVIKNNDITPKHGRFRSHKDILVEQNMIKFSNASPGGYYLLGPLAHREHEILHSCTERLLEESLVPVTCPDIFKTLVVEGCGVDFRDPQQILTIQDKEELRTASGKVDKKKELSDTIYTWDNTFHLSGTSTMSFAAYLTRMNINEEDLPLRCYSVGRRYLPVTDPLMNDGLMSAGQGTSVELFGAATTRDESMSIFEEFSSLVWDLHQLWLPRLPIRLVNVPSEHLESSEMARTSLQMWLPSVNEYRQVASISASGDYISRRLMMKYSRDEKNVTDASYLHTVHCAALNVPRVLAGMIESGDTVGDKR